MDGLPTILMIFSACSYNIGPFGKFILVSFMSTNVVIMYYEVSTLNMGPDHAINVQCKAE